MARPPRLLAPALVAGLALGLAAGAARAQSTEYRLDQSGNWVQVKSPEAGTDEALIAEARKALAEDRPADAQRLVDPWIDAHDRSRDPLLPAALLVRADALTAQGDEYNALYDYERIIKDFGGTTTFITAVERELDIGVRYTGGLKRRFFGVRMLPAEDIGEELLIRTQERVPGSRLGERALIELADWYYRNRELDLAVDAYDLFVQNYPTSQYRSRALQRRIYATIGRFKGPRYDGSALVDARILTRRYASLYPTEAQAAGLDDGLLTRLDESAGQEFIETATYYFRRNDEVAARFLLRRLLREHPKTAAAQKALEIMKERGWSAEIPRLKRSATPEEGDFESAPGTKIERPAGDAAKPGAGSGAAPSTTTPGERPPPVEPRRRRAVPGSSPSDQPPPSPSRPAPAADPSGGPTLDPPGNAADPRPADQPANPPASPSSGGTPK
jgi:hypothetical protein